MSSGKNLSCGRCRDHVILHLNPVVFIPGSFHPFRGTLSISDFPDIHRICLTKQTNAFEDYAEGRITRQEYLSYKQTVAGQQEEMMARYTELNIKKAELKQASGSFRLEEHLLTNNCFMGMFLYQPVAGIHILHLK